MLQPWWTFSPSQLADDSLLDGNLSDVSLPLWAMVAWLWLRESLMAAQLAGGVVVLVGVVLAQTSR